MTNTTSESPRHSTPESYYPGRVTLRLTDDYEPCGHWTDYVKINHAFARNLWDLTGPDNQRYHGPVTNFVAYLIYAMWHAKPITWARCNNRFGDVCTYKSMRINVRAQLCALEHLKILKRIAPGKYVWLTSPHSNAS